MKFATMKKYKLVLFDLDGTLLDTIEDLGEAVNRALEKRGLPLHSLAEYRTMVGHGVRNLVWKALPEEYRGDDVYVDSCLADFREWYEAHIDVHTRPYAGIPEMIDRLNASGVKMAVASNKFQEGAEYLVKEFFPGIPFVSVLGNKPGFPLKPDPAIVGEVLEKSGIGREDAVLVGDSLTDLKTAQNGGIDAVAVSWGYSSAEQLSGARLVNTVSELIIFLT